MFTLIITHMMVCVDAWTLESEVHLALTGLGLRKYIVGAIRYTLGG